MSDQLRRSIQQLLDQHGDGWAVTQYVVVMGLERLDSSGQVESIAWLYTPLEQADWQTTGLLEHAQELHHESLGQDDY